MPLQQMQETAPVDRQLEDLGQCSLEGRALHAFQIVLQMLAMWQSRADQRQHLDDSAEDIVYSSCNSHGFICLDQEASGMLCSRSGQLCVSDGAARREMFQKTGKIGHAYRAGTSQAHEHPKLYKYKLRMRRTSNSGK